MSEKLTTEIHRIIYTFRRKFGSLWGRYFFINITLLPSQTFTDVQIKLPVNGKYNSEARHYNEKTLLI